MYEMEGALPGCVAPGSPVARLTRHYAPPAGTGNPRDVPVSRYFPRPGVAPRRFPFPTVKVFLLLSPAVAQESGGIHFKFFGIHMISTEHRRLSARYDGYPPAHPQLIHRLPNVIHRTLI